MNVLVFGSNLAGRHGAGSALEARKKHGACYGQGYGRQGASFAIPTKDAQLHTLSLPTIQKYIEMFVEYAKQHPEDTFNVVKIGCGLAGYRESDIRRLWSTLQIPTNVNLPWR